MISARLACFSLGLAVTEVPDPPALGKNSFIWVGPIPTVTITEPELIGEVLSKIHDFPKQGFGVAQLLVPGLFSYNGEKWAKHRKIINPAFRLEKLKLMIPAIQTSVHEMMKSWEKKVSSETSSVEMDIWPHLGNMTADAISRAAFGSSHEEGRKAFELIEEQSQSIIYGSKLRYLIPGWRYVPTKGNKRFNKIDNEIRDTIRGVIDKRSREMEAGEATKQDLLGILMECNLVEMNQGGDKLKMHLGMTMDEVIDECKLFYLAGQETTANLLAFTMILLARYADWQTRAREEVLQAFGKSDPDSQGLNNLKIVNMILHEVLRLYPPITTMWRKVEDDTSLGKLFLPAGVYLHMPVICSHHDPHYWGEDVSEFKPERFSQGVSKAAQGNNIFLPFGMGPRVCIGQKFALIEAKLALSMILQRFSFELSPSYAHAPSKLIIIRPQFGAHIILHKL